MRLLLDTHALLWWLSGDTSLPHSAKKLIGSRNSQVLVSAASAWEIATKVRLGRLDVPADLAKDFGGTWLGRDSRVFRSAPSTAFAPVHCPARTRIHLIECWWRRRRLKVWRL